MKTNCQQCGVEFEGRPHRVRAGTAKHCSRECAVMAQRKTKTVPCAYCGNHVTRANWAFRAEHAYCSKSCCGKHVSALARPPVRIDGDFAFIPLDKGLWAKVDRADYESIPMLGEVWTARRPGISRTFYASRKENGFGVWMHRVITNAPKGMEVNHRNHDGLDNTRANIEICTRQENGRYVRKPLSMNRKPCSSRYKGVSWSPQWSKWRAGFGNRTLGYFLTEEEAAETYNRVAAASFGDFAYLNVIDRKSE